MPPKPSRHIGTMKLFSSRNAFRNPAAWRIWEDPSPVGEGSSVAINMAWYAVGLVTIAAAAATTIATTAAATGAGLTRASFIDGQLAPTDVHAL